MAGLVATVPANAGVEWGDPQEVSSRYGWQVQLSDDGEMAAWIRVGNRPGPGPVRTSKYKGTKKGWSKSKAVPGSAESKEVVLGQDGDTLLIKLPTAYATSTRKGASNTWRGVETVADGDNLFGGALSADGQTVVWVKPPPMAFPPQPGTLLARTRAADGSWGPETQVGEFISRGNYYGGSERTWVALSTDGSTVAWLNNSAQLVSAGKAADGTWGAPSVIQQYSNDQFRNPEVSYLQLSANGSRVLWQSANSAVLTSTQTSTGWAPVTYVMQNDLSSVAMSPNGKVVAYGQLDPARLRVRRYKSGEWIKPKTLGPSQYPQIVVRNKAVAWVEQESKASKLRVSLLRKGKWRNTTVIAPKAQSPALSRKGDTLAYAGKQAGGIFSVKR